MRLNKITTVLSEIQKSHRILAITEKEQRLTMARRYLKDIEIVDSFDAISWVDILFRRVRLIAVPGKPEAHSKRERCKRKAIKLLGLSISGELGQANFEDCLLGEHGPKVIFAPAQAVVLIYQRHLTKDFTVLELKDELRTHRMKDIVAKAEHARELGFLDKKPGLTVFTNVREDTNLRAYKKIHPNRRIVLRYHDRLDYGLGERSPNKKCLLKMIAALKRDRVVDEVESYYRADAELMGGIYRPNAVNPSVMATLQYPMRDAIYRFIGGPTNAKTQTRLDALKDIRNALRQIYSNADRWIDECYVLGPSAWKPYSEYLKETARAEVIVDLVRIGQEEGFSYRIPEALFLNRKIITNRQILRDEPFYSPERIFLIGIDPVSRLKTFLESDLEPLPDDILRLYDARLWWTDKDPRLNANNTAILANENQQDSN